MCLRALVPITLALIWTSSLTGWSTTAHPLIGRASLSGIVPRGGPAIPISELTEGVLEEKRREYRAKPSKPYVSTVIPLPMLCSAYLLNALD